MSQVGGAGKKSTSLLYKEIEKIEFLSDQRKTKKTKNNETNLMLTEVMQVPTILKFWILLILNYSLKILNLQINAN